jgi:hypothetical protein
MALAGRTQVWTIRLCESPLNELSGKKPRKLELFGQSLDDVAKAVLGAVSD